MKNYIKDKPNLNKENQKNLLKTKTPATESLLTPRFYTTNFDEMSQLDISTNRLEIEATIQEFRVDYNQHHFIRDQQFNKPLTQFDEASKSLIVEFLERSCTAEFSGFLLYKELSRHLKTKNPLLAEGFAFMSRDEARHAGFLNKSMSDFNVTLDLGFLTKSRKYTFFSPKFIFYATYLSEKIGYWRYITIYKHLEQNPEYRVHPIFRFFESWCQDENRHADFFAAILKSQPKLLTTSIAKLWCRFFLLSVFTTMYLNDLQRSNFYKLLGLDAKEFDRHVIEKTNTSAGRLFPVILNVKHPYFFLYLDNCAEANLALIKMNNKQKTHFGHILQNIIYFSQRCLNYFIIMKNLVYLYFLAPINSQKEWDTIF
ncbi:unnamed protein product [Ascophyllum nodosum]